MAPTHAERVRILPPLLIWPCDAAGVAACLSSRGDGFESRTGRSSRAGDQETPSRLVPGNRQVQVPRKFLRSGLEPGPSTVS